MTHPNPTLTLDTTKVVTYKTTKLNSMWTYFIQIFSIDFRLLEWRERAVFQRKPQLLQSHFTGRRCELEKERASYALGDKCLFRARKLFEVLICFQFSKETFGGGIADVQNFRCVVTGQSKLCYQYDNEKSSLVVQLCLWLPWNLSCCLGGEWLWNWRLLRVHSLHSLHHCFVSNTVLLSGAEI